MTPREVEKLKAIGYEVERYHNFGDTSRAFWRSPAWSDIYRAVPTEEEVWKEHKAHAQSPEGMKATMADKVRWLRSASSGPTICLNGSEDGATWSAETDPHPDARSHYVFGGPQGSPEAAVDALFWKVP